MEQVKKCLFCDKILIPVMYSTSMENVKKYFEEIKESYTLNYSILETTIGNKNICTKCLYEFKNYIFYSKDCDCESCTKIRKKKERELI